MKMASGRIDPLYGIARMVCLDVGEGHVCIDVLKRRGV
jgi:hypothetical protein